MVAAKNIRSVAVSFLTTKYVAFLFSSVLNKNATDLEPVAFLMLTDYMFNYLRGS
ncbi:hypothetical protein P20652_2393 [Pseudoalteromonas sp. BSi20652]|nr:hypothetical protein P20652_2393 [Pseudoalteromonas sp. BSi20652]